MLRSSFIDPVHLAAACIIPIALAQNLSAQTAPSGTTADDPKALLAATAAVNGAPGDTAKPWHAKITFTLFDWDKKPQFQGEIEEFWAGPHTSKIIYTTPSFNQVEYDTPSGIRRTSTRDGAPPELLRVLDEFFHPLSADAAAMDSLKLKAQEMALGQTKLDCVFVESDQRDASSSAPRGTYCMSKSAPVLRLHLAPGAAQRTLRNDIVRFQDKYLAQNIQRVLAIPGDRSARTQFEGKLTIEFLDPVNEQQFTPPAGAMIPPNVIDLDEKATRAQLLEHKAPIYPPIAKAARVSGDVVLSLQILSDGRVQSLRVLSGPPMLQQASLDAVKKWVYKPFEQSGDAVEVNTTVTIPFRLMP